MRTSAHPNHTMPSCASRGSASHLTSRISQPAECSLSPSASNFAAVYPCRDHPRVSDLYLPLLSTVPARSDGNDLAKTPAGAMGSLRRYPSKTSRVHFANRLPMLPPSRSPGACVGDPSCYLPRVQHLAPGVVAQFFYIVVLRRRLSVQSVAQHP